jgi:OOP family OmpA-OmpF porin
MKKKHLLALAALSGLGLLPMAQASDDPVDDRWYVAPFGSYLHAGGDRDSNDGFGGGMGFGKMIDEHFNVELKGFYQYAGGEGTHPWNSGARTFANSGGYYNNGNWDLTGGTADVQYFIFRDTFSPYTVLGVGGMNTSHNGRSGATFIGEAGAGFTYEVSDNFLLRSDVRYRYNNNFNANTQPGTNEFHDMVVNVGFVVPFGPKPKAAVAEVPPAPVAVADCSTMDDDNDGVNNCDDLCPDTLPGVPVSIKGCWIVDVKFDFDKYNIRPEFFANLDNAAQKMREHPEKAIEVQGHTDNVGSFQYNQRLSERRADAVKKYLMEGSGRTDITSRGFSFSQPIDTNETEAGRANNRRVQLEIEGAPQQPLSPQLPGRDQNIDTTLPQ